MLMHHYLDQGLSLSRLRLSLLASPLWSLVQILLDRPFKEVSLQTFVEEEDSVP